MPRSCPAGSGSCGRSRPRGQGSDAPAAPFFQSHPVPLGPDRDHQFVALLGPCGGTLHAEAMRLERPLQVARVVVHPELALDQGRDALKRPPFGDKASRDGTPAEEPAQPGPGPLIEPRGRPEVGARCEAAWALLGESGGPAADTGRAGPGATAPRLSGGAPPSAPPSDVSVAKRCLPSRTSSR